MPLLACALALLSTPGRAQTVLPPPELVAPSGEAADAGLPTTLAGIHALLEGVTGPEFESLAERLLVARPEPSRDALVLRAGTPPPPGLTAARASRREAMRAEAVEFLRRGIAAADEESSWIRRLGEILDEPFPDEDLRRAAIGAAAALERRELGPAIARNLRPEESPRLQDAARNALHELFARWFADEASFTEVWGRLAGVDADGLFLDELRAREARARELLLHVVELQLLEAPRALEDPDPAVRAATARLLGRAVGEQRVSAEAAVDTLLSHLESEVELRAFHATLDSLLELLTGAPPGSPLVVRLREALDRVAERRLRHLEWPILNALGRLPWDPALASGPDSLNEGIARFAGLFRRAVDPNRPLDSDQLLKGLRTLRSLCARAPDPAAIAGRAHAASDAVRFLLESYRGSPEVRIAAASALSIVVSADDLDAICQALDNGDDPTAVAYELLGALGRVVPRLDPGEPTRRALEVLVQHVSHPEVDLRRRALEVLSAESLAPIVTGPDEGWIVERLVERLEDERVAELQSPLIALIGRFRRPDLVDRILHSPSFDDLTAGGSRRMQELVAALGRLAGGDAERVLRIAERLLLNADASDRYGRLEQAIALIAGLSDEAALGLTPSQHGEVVAWAVELREDSGSRAGGPDSLSQLLERLVTVHLPRAAQQPIDRRALARARAVFGGDRLVRNRDGANQGAVLADYEAAIAFAANPPAGYASPASDAEIRRDRARFFDAIQDPKNALGDYTTLLELANGSGTRPPVTRTPDGRPLLELSDLRRASDLLAASAANVQQAQPLRARACRVAHELVERPSWRHEPGTVRLEDLKALVERALASKSPDLIARAHAIFADLPDLPTAGAVEGNGNGHAADEDGPLWSGLLRERAWHEELLRLAGLLPTLPTKAKAEEASASVGPRGDTIRPHD